MLLAQAIIPMIEPHFYVYAGIKFGGGGGGCLSKSRKRKNKVLEKNVLLNVII